MRCVGRALPRRKVGVGGLVVRAAQSSGLWPGGRITLREGREAGGRVEVVAARAEEGVEEDLGGARKVEARDGGGAREEELLSFGRGRRALGRGGGGGIRREAD